MRDYHNIDKKEQASLVGWLVGLDLKGAFNIN